ncbi:MAG: UTP--glucose-1-phosphate uridylyltransferase [Rhodovulum sp.]
MRADHDLIETLRARGKAQLAQELHDAALDEEDHEVEFVMQHDQLGLGHAVLCARPHVLPGPVAVLLPDDLILSQPGCLAEMIAAYEGCGAGHMVAAMEVPEDEVSRYGVLAPSRMDGPLTHATGMVEKPAPEAAPSLKAVVGRYILDGSIFDTLDGLPPGANDEIQLTDSIAADAGRIGLVGYDFSGRRFDCGAKAGMLEATLALASGHPEYAPVLARALDGAPLAMAAE